jgi:hypothetical protein
MSRKGAEVSTTIHTKLAEAAEQPPATAAPVAEVLGRAARLRRRRRAALAACTVAVTGVVAGGALTALPSGPEVVGSGLPGPSCTAAGPVGNRYYFAPGYPVVAVAEVEAGFPSMSYQGKTVPTGLVTAKVRQYLRGTGPSVLRLDEHVVVTPVRIVVPRIIGSLSPGPYVVAGRFESGGRFSVDDCVMTPLTMGLNALALGFVSVPGPTRIFGPGIPLSALG